MLAKSSHWMQHFGYSASHGLHELVDEGRIFVAAHAVLPQAEIQRVLQQRLVVRADIERDGQAVLRWHAGAGGVEREFAKRNAHAADAEVAEAEDPFAVGHHDEADVLLRPVGQQLFQPPSRSDRQVHARGCTKDMIELLAGFATVGV